MIRIIVADDHALVRNGICRILNAEEDMEIVEEAGNGMEAIALCREFRPDVVVMDYDMPKIDGYEATQQISAMEMGIKILVLTMYDREDIALRFLKAGALGFLPKSTTFEELPFAVRKVAAGSIYMTASASDNKDWAPLAKSALISEHDKKNMVDLLSDREFQILKRFAQGRTTSEIAEELEISSNTVKTYRYRAMEKLNLKNSYELVRLAVRTGLIDDK